MFWGVRKETHLVGFALARAGAHRIHPQVGVQIIRTHTCVRIHHLCHGHQRHGCHAAAVHEEQHKRKVSEREPDPSREQHPPHVTNHSGPPQTKKGENPKGRDSKNLQTPYNLLLDHSGRIRSVRAGPDLEEVSKFKAVVRKSPWRSGNMSYSSPLCARTANPSWVTVMINLIKKKEKEKSAADSLLHKELSPHLCVKLRQL